MDNSSCSLELRLFIKHRKDLRGNDCPDLYGHADFICTIEQLSPFPKYSYRTSQSPPPLTLHINSVISSHLFPFFLSLTRR